MVIVAYYLPCDLLKAVSFTRSTRQQLKHSDAHVAHKWRPERKMPYRCREEVRLFLSKLFWAHSSSSQQIIKLGDLPAALRFTPSP